MPKRERTSTSASMGWPEVTAVLPPKRSWSFAPSPAAKQKRTAIGSQSGPTAAPSTLRSIRRRAPDDSLVSVSGADPLNLAGTLLPGAKVPALASNRLVYRDGLPVAAEVAGKPQFWVELDSAAMSEIRNRLTRH